MRPAAWRSPPPAQEGHRNLNLATGSGLAPSLKTEERCPPGRAAILGGPRHHHHWPGHCHRGRPMMPEGPDSDAERPKLPRYFGRVADSPGSMDAPDLQQEH